MLNNKSILITGGTGSFGRAFCEVVSKRYNPERLIIYSRDEFKQSQMQEETKFQRPFMRFFLGDVRDKERLTRAMNGVDIVIHTAALKQVPAAEYNPHEFIKTNITGATNLVEAALNSNVAKVLALSTDKAVNPINLYGATKLCSDKIFTAANSYRGKKPTAFSVVRYGNVMGSRGSVIPRFIQERDKGTLTITDLNMTRFYITLEESVNFVLMSLEKMVGGELFIPKLPSCKLGDLAKAIAPTAEYNIIGVREGEKCHEMLIPQDEARLTLEYDNHYIIKSPLVFWGNKFDASTGTPCPPEFSYASNNNTWWLNVNELKERCEAIERELSYKDNVTPCLSA